MKRFLYYLTDELGRSYYIENGVLKTSALRNPLDYTPDGWQDVLIGWERDMSRIGLRRSFSLPLGFVEDGAHILRRLFYGQGLETKIFLLIQQRVNEVTDTDFAEEYYTLYKGQLDLATFKDEPQKVTVSIAESGLAKLLKAKEGITEEFPMNDPETITVKMDGILLSQTGNLVMPDGIEISNKDYEDVVMPISYINSDGTSIGVAFFSQRIENTNNPNNYATTSNNFFLKASDSNEAPVTFAIVGKIRFQVTKNNIGGSFVPFFRTSTGQGFNFPRIKGPAGPHLEGQTYEFTLNGDITLAPGEKMFSFATIGSVSVPSAIEMIVKMLPDSDIKISYKNKSRTTYIKAYKPTTLLKKLVYKMTTNENKWVSTLLQAHEGKVLTCGDAIRGIAEAKLKTSFNQFLEDCQVRYAAGMSIEGEKIVIEALSYFLNTTNVVHLGQAKDLTISPATDLMANSLKIGYPDQNIDDINGRKEFNNTHLYSSSVTAVVREDTRISPYLAQPYVIELTRINLEGKTTTDNSADNQVFVLDTEPVRFTGRINAGGALLNSFLLYDGGALSEDFPAGTTFILSGAAVNTGTYTVTTALPIPFTNDLRVFVSETVQLENLTSATLLSSLHKLNRDSNMTITGVPDPATIFNIGLSPKRLAINYAPWLNSVYYFVRGQQLIWKTTEKNADLKTILNGVTIEEKANLTIGNNRLFIPLYVECTIATSVDLVALLETNPHTAFSIEWGGETYTILPTKGGVSINDHKEQLFKGLLAPNTDLTKLF